MIMLTRFLLPLLIFSALSAGAQKLVVSTSSFDFKPLDQALVQNQKVLDKNFTVLVFKDSKIVYGKEMGESKANIPVGLGSTSKWLTAALTLMFVDQGKLSLDDKVSTYLPIFKSYGKAYITIRQCLTHFTGIASPGFGNLHVGKYLNLEAEVNDIPKREIQTNPGTEFRYSDAGYAIVGRILEVISKKPFDRLVKETLFRPLGMMRSTFSNMDGKAPDPAEGALCTPLDLLSFSAMVLGKGVYNGKRILSDSSMAELLKQETTPQEPKTVPQDMEGYNYALGSWISAPGVYLAPSLSGSWAVVDLNKGYAAVIVVTKEFKEPQRSVFNAIKAAIDGAFP